MRIRNKNARLMLIVPAFAITVLIGGCQACSSSVEVSAWGMHFKLQHEACQEIPVDGGAVTHWATGNNDDAFKPAIYRPNPGPPRQWCLRVQLHGETASAVLVEHVSYRGRSGTYHKENGTYTVYFVPEVKIRRDPQSCTIGSGRARILNYRYENGVLVRFAPEDPYGMRPVSSMVSFWLRTDPSPDTTGLIKNAFTRFGPIMQVAEKDMASIRSSTAK